MAGPSRPSARVRIAFDREALVRFCLQRAIRRLGFFGSVLRDDFDDRSDVDVLVEFLPGHTPGLAFFEMEEELSLLLGRRVPGGGAEGPEPFILREAHGAPVRG